MIMDNRNKMIRGTADSNIKLEVVDTRQTHESNLSPCDESEVVDFRGLEVVRLNGREAQNYMDSILTEVFESDVK